MTKAALKILMVIALLLAAVGCGSDGFDNGVTSTVETGNPGGDKSDKGGPLPE